MAAVDTYHMMMQTCSSTRSKLMAPTNCVSCMSPAVEAQAEQVSCHNRVLAGKKATTTTFVNYFVLRWLLYTWHVQIELKSLNVRGGGGNRKFGPGGWARG